VKIKNILGAVVATAGALLMSTTAFAASNVSFGEMTVDGEYIGIPIVYNSTDYDDFYGCTIELSYDKAKYTFDGCDGVEETTYKDGRNTKTAEILTVKSNDVYDGTTRVLAYADDTIPDFFAIENANEKDSLFTVWFKVNSGVGSADEIGLKVLDISQVPSGSTKAVDINSDYIASYVTYTFNKDDTSHGYVYALNATLTSQKDSSKTATVPLTNYYLDDEGNYVFVLKIVGSETDVVDIVINGMVSKKANAAESEWTEEKIDTIENVTVRKLS